MCSLLCSLLTIKVPEDITGNYILGNPNMTSMPTPKIFGVAFSFWHKISLETLVFLRRGIETECTLASLSEGYRYLLETWSTLEPPISLEPPVIMQLYCFQG